VATAAFVKTGIVVVVGGVVLVVVVVVVVSGAKALPLSSCKSPDTLSATYKNHAAEWCSYFQ